MGPAEEQAEASARLRSRPAPQGRGESPTPAAARPPREPTLTNAPEAVPWPPRARGRGSGPASCLTGHLTLRKPPRLSQPQFPHLGEGQGEWLTPRAAVMAVKSAHGVLSLPPAWRSGREGPQGGQAAIRGPGTSPRPLRPSRILSFTKVNPQHHRGEGDHVVLQPSDPSQ